MKLNVNEKYSSQALYQTLRTAKMNFEKLSTQDCLSAPSLVFAVLPIPTQFNDLSDSFPVLLNLVSVRTVRMILKFVTQLRLFYIF